MIKILIVDDEVKTCELLERFLVKKRYSIITSINGKDALEKVRNEKPEIMLLDLKLPDMDGMVVLRKSREISPETMVIIHTACGGLASAIDAVRLNASDYVLKPVNLEELHFRVLRCVEKLKLQRKIKLYEKILPVCCVCKKIRDDKGYWKKVEDYIEEHSDASFTHGICPNCLQKADPETYEEYEEKIKKALK